jgi:hypothetical protein
MKRSAEAGKAIVPTILTQPEPPEQRPDWFSRTDGYSTPEAPRRREDHAEYKRRQERAKANARHEAAGGSLGDVAQDVNIVTRAQQIAAVTGRPLAEVERELAEDEDLD